MSDIAARWRLPVADAAPAVTLYSIQYLRAVAALMVVYHHARDRVPSFAEALPSPIGQAGVDLFFVISGFIMVVTTWSQPINPVVFLRRRVLRIVPIYWLYTTLLAGCILLFPTALKLSLTVPHLAYSLLFIPHESPFGGSVSPLLQPGWTLNYEMFFYCVFAVCLVVRADHRAAAVTLVLGGLVLSGWALAPSDPVALTYTSALLLEFAIGAWVGHLHRTGALSGLNCGIGRTLIAAGALLAIGATEFVLPKEALFDFSEAPMRATIYGTAAFLLVTGALCCEQAPQQRSASPRTLFLLRLFHHLGDASYTLYLTHLFVIGALRVVWLGCGLGTEGTVWAMLFVIAALVTSSAVGMLAYRHVEAPITAAGRHLLEPQTKGSLKHGPARGS